MPLARGKRCEDCYWKQLFSKRHEINRESLESAYFQDKFDCFSGWLCWSTSAHKAALSIARFTDFFIEIEKSWEKIPPYKALLSTLGADYLRRYRKVIEWMVYEKYLVVESVSQKTVSEMHRIQRILSRVPIETVGYKLLQGFWSEQKLRYLHDKVSILTIRLSLTPATAYLAVCGFGEPTSRGLATYLSMVPGQRASITKFISYLNKSRGYDINFPKRINKVSTAKEKLEKQLMQLASGGSATLDLPQWCGLAMSVFHGVLIAPKKLETGHVAVRKVERGYLVEYKNEQYFVPGPNT